MYHFKQKELRWWIEQPKHERSMIRKTIRPKMIKKNIVKLRIKSVIFQSRFFCYDQLTSYGIGWFYGPPYTFRCKVRTITVFPELKTRLFPVISLLHGELEFSNYKRWVHFNQIQNPLVFFTLEKGGGGTGMSWVDEGKKTWRRERKGYILILILYFHLLFQLIKIFSHVTVQFPPNLPSFSCNYTFSIWSN